MRYRGGGHVTFRHTRRAALPAPAVGHSRLVLPQQWQLTDPWPGDRLEAELGGLPGPRPWGLAQGSASKGPAPTTAAVPPPPVIPAKVAPSPQRRRLKCKLLNEIAELIELLSCKIVGTHKQHIFGACFFCAFRAVVAHIFDDQLRMFSTQEGSQKGRWSTCGCRALPLLGRRATAP